MSRPWDVRPLRSVMCLMFLMGLQQSCRHEVAVRNQAPAGQPRPSANALPTTQGAPAATPSTSPVGIELVTPSIPGPNVTVSALNGTHVYFGGEKDNHRVVAVPVEFPDGKYMFSSISLSLRLSCPQNRCDAWDRAGSLMVVTKDQQRVEVARFSTPYGVGVDWDMDVSYLTPLLTGSKTVEIFIDTWVGPGNPQGEGWLVDATFTFEGGLRSPVPVAVVPIFGPENVDYGDPEKPALRQKTIPLPLDTFKSAKIRSFTTGHGQGNEENCAEFCPKTHSLSANQQKDAKKIWRADCGRTQTQNPQRGTWTLSRAGWCPGALVTTWDLTVALPAQSLNVTYEPEPYINGRSTGYNGSSHTQPYFRWSSALVLYK